MPDVAINVQQVQSAGDGYTVPDSQEIVVKAVRAQYNGQGAGGSFVPTLQIVTDAGLVVAEFPIGATVAAGASADVTWFRGVGAQAAESAGGGIDFNQTNAFAADGALASYLYLNLIGSSPYTGESSWGPLSIFTEDTGTGGSFLHRMDGSGYIALVSTASSPPARNWNLPVEIYDVASNHATGNFDKGAIALENVGQGDIYMVATGGQIVLSNNDWGIHLFSSGSDWNGAAVKVSLNGGNFLLQDSQSVSRNSGGTITDTTPDNPFFRAGSTAIAIQTYEPDSEGIVQILSDDIELLLIGEADPSDQFTSLVLRSQAEGFPTAFLGGADGIALTAHGGDIELACAEDGQKILFSASEIYIGQVHAPPPASDPGNPYQLWVDYDTGAVMMSLP